MSVYKCCTINTDQGRLFLSPLARYLVEKGEQSVFGDCSQKHTRKLFLMKTRISYKVISLWLVVLVGVGGGGGGGYVNPSY